MYNNEGTIPQTFNFILYTGFLLQTFILQIALKLVWGNSTLVLLWQWNKALSHDLLLD